MPLELTFRHELSVPAPPSAVYDYLADFTTTNEWDPRARNTVRSWGDGAVGSRYECLVRFLGRDSKMEYTVTALEPGARIEWTGRNKIVRAHDTITISEGAPGTTRLRYDASFSYGHLPMPLALLFAFPLRRLCEDARIGLQRTLTKELA